MNLVIQLTLTILFYEKNQDSNPRSPNYYPKKKKGGLRTKEPRSLSKIRQSLKKWEMRCENYKNTRMPIFIHRQDF